jgi:hypothetical protein
VIAESTRSVSFWPIASRRNTQFLDREIQALHPKRRVTKQLGADDISAAKRAEDNIFPP